MATRTKHMERSHRSYRSNKANKYGFCLNSAKRAETNKYFKDSGSFIDKFFGMFRSMKGDK